MYARVYINLIILVFLLVFTNSAEAQLFKISAESQGKFEKWMNVLHDDYNADIAYNNDSTQSYHTYLKKHPTGKSSQRIRQTQLKLIEKKELELKQVILSAREYFQKGEYLLSLKSWERIVDEIPYYKYLKEAASSAEKSKNELKYLSYMRLSLVSELLYEESSEDRRNFLLSEMDQINQIIRSYVTGRFNEGVSELNNGRSLNAFNIFSNIIELDPENTNALDKLSEVAKNLKRFDEAKKILKKGMITAANLRNHKLFIDFENKLFNLLNIWPDEAIDLVNQNSFISDSEDDKLAYQNWSDLKNKAYDHFYKKEYMETLKFLDQQIKVASNYFGRDHHFTLIPLKDKAYILGQISEYQEQKDLLKQLLSRYKNIYGGKHPLTISVMKELADKVSFTDHNILNKYTKILELERQTYGDVHPQNLITINSIIDYYYYNYRIDEARYYLDEATELMREMYGESSTLMPKLYERLAAKHQKLRQTSSQQKAITSRLVILDKTKGRDNPKFADALVEYSNLPEKDQHSKEIEIILEKALHIGDSSGVSQNRISPYLLERLGYIYLKKGKYKVSERLLKRAEKIVMQKDKKNLNFLATLKNNLSLNYHKQGNLEEAENYIKEAINLRIKHFGADDQNLASSYNDLGFVYKDKQEYRKAEENYLKAASILEKDKGPYEYMLATIYSNLSSLFKEQSRFEDAENYLIKAIDLLTKNFGKSDLALANLFNDLGFVYQDKKEYRKAEENYLKAVSISEKNKGINEPNLAIYFSNLSLLSKEQGKLKEAEKYLFKAITLQKKHFGESDLKLVDMYNDLGFIYKDKQEYRKAEENYLKAVSISEQIEGPNNPRLAILFSNLGYLYYEEMDHKKSSNYYRKSIIIEENYHGTNYPNLSNSYIDYAGALQMSSRFDEAYEFLQKALVLNKKLFGDQSDEVALLYGKIGGHYLLTGKFKESLKYHIYRKNLVKNILGENNNSYIETLIDIGTMYTKLGDYKNSHSALSEAYNISVKLLGENKINPMLFALISNNYLNESKFDKAIEYIDKNIDLMRILNSKDTMSFFIAYNNKGLIYLQMSLHDKSLESFRLAESELDKFFEKNNIAYGMLFNNLGYLYIEKGEYQIAEKYLKKGLHINEKLLGEIHPSNGQSVNNLGLLYMYQNRFELAGKYIKRSLSILDNQFNYDHPDKIVPLTNLGAIEKNLKNYSKAEEIFKRAIKITENLLGGDHYNLIKLFFNLGSLYSEADRHKDSIQIYERGLAISRKNSGPLASMNLIFMNNIALSYINMDNFLKAEEYYKEAYGISLRKPHQNILEFALLLNNYANLYMQKFEYEKSLEFFRQSSEIYKNKIFELNNEKNYSQKRMYANLFAPYLLLLSKPHFNLVEQFVKPKDYKLFNEGLEIGQYARVSRTSSALKKMSARLSASDARLSDLVRIHQNSNKKLNILEKKLEIMVGTIAAKRNKTEESVLRDKISNVNKNIYETNMSIESAFPDYYLLTQQHSIDLKSIQRLLKKDEALISYLSTESTLFVWAISQRSYIYRPINITTGELTQKIKAIRKSATTASAGFNFKKSNELYMEIIKPIESVIKDVKHLNVVTDKSLQSLPFSILVTKQNSIAALNNSKLEFGSSTRGLSGVSGNVEKTDGLNKYENYRNAGWLTNKYSISYFPSIPSIKYLRDSKKEKVGDDTRYKFIGFGNPSIENAFTMDKEPEIENEDFIASLNTRGKIFNRNEILELTDLPETADELLSIAKSLGSTNQSVFLGQDATETKLKALDLSKYSILAFATHGLMANEISGVEEPSLVLTPPSKPSVLDDGLLTSSEISQLKLNADWVILSACNTAASDGTPGADGFSGLAKSFFYAGARSLLVSHWPVASEATVELTTNMFEEMRTDPYLGKSEALRRSRLKLINDSNNPEYAHPYFWAPFVLVGDGARKQLLK
jgi:CHAT domain-containing protein/Tfp pilus assembly protein PilF